MNNNNVKGSVQINGQKIPDPKLHQNISFLKSSLRLGACAFGIFGFLGIAFSGLIVAELIGILEELV